MALKRLRTEEMVAITSTWVDPSHADRQAMAQEPALAPLMPQVDAAHGGLCATHDVGPSAVRLKQIQGQQKEVDVVHDDVLRGIWSYLWALVYFARTDEEREVFMRLIALLLPDGLQAVNKSYREEAGQAELAGSRLTDADRAVLQTLTLPDGRTLLDLVNQWLSLGANLGALDRERNGYIANEGPTPAEAATARHQWIRTVQAVQDVAALVAANNPVIQEIMARVEAAGLHADRRASSGALPDDPDEPAGEPAVPGNEQP
jgi:hypothetical protein